MSYRVRYTMPDGRSGHWMRDYATREEAQKAIDDRHGDTGLAYAVEEVPEPGATAAHHVEILRERVKELEEVQKAMHRDLTFAIQIGDAMHRAMTTAQSRFYVDWGEIKVALAEWTAYKDSLAASRQGAAKASEAPGEGGDSDRRRLEALERWLKGHTWRRIRQVNGYGMVTESHDHGIELVAPTLAALADKLAEKEDKP